MSWYNPQIYTDLTGMSEQEVLVAIYQFIVAFGLSCLALATFFAVFRFFVWLLPRYYNKDSEGKS